MRGSSDNEFSLHNVLRFFLAPKMNIVIGPLFVRYFAPMRHRRAPRVNAADFIFKPFPAVYMKMFWNVIDREVAHGINEFAFGGIVVFDRCLVFAEKGYCVRKWPKIGPFSPGFFEFI